jgi:processive 1,2-diacylglycerol beta-glucosyltransferase
VDKKRKILIAYATAGAGHIKAGQAICDAFHRMQGDFELHCADFLTYSTPTMRVLYPSLYVFLINRCPFIWGFLYYLTDIRPVYICIRPLLSLTNFINCRKFRRFVLNEKPDVVISTHFESSRMVSELTKKGLYKGKLLTVITDLMPHSFWITDPVDRYVVGSREAKKTLVNKWKVRPENVEALGIPVDPVFTENKSREDLTRKLNLRQDLFTVLIASGGFGIGPVEEMVSALQDMGGLQLMVVCGRNSKLKERLDKRDYKIPTLIYGFVNNMDELMTVADIMVSKSGGLSTSEALVKNLPLIVIAPVPGQETRNCGVLLENNAAMRAYSGKQVHDMISRLIGNPDMRANLKVNIQNLARPDSAKSIATLSLSV